MPVFTTVHLVAVAGFSPTRKACRHQWDLLSHARLQSLAPWKYRVGPLLCPDQDPPSSKVWRRWTPQMPHLVCNATLSMGTERENSLVEFSLAGHQAWTQIPCMKYTCCYNGSCVHVAQYKSIYDDSAIVLHRTLAGEFRQLMKHQLEDRNWISQPFIIQEYIKPTWQEDGLFITHFGASHIESSCRCYSRDWQILCKHHKVKRFLKKMGVNCRIWNTEYVEQHFSRRHP